MSPRAAWIDSALWGALFGVLAVALAALVVKWWGM
jgi:hypothetical protein